MSDVHNADPGEQPLAPEAEAPVAEAPVEAQPEPGEAPEAAAPEPEAGEEPKPERKSPVAQLKGRVGYLTKSLHEKDAALEESNRRNAALMALLEQSGIEIDAPSAPAAPAATPQDPADYDRRVREAAAQLTQEERFVQECNDAYAKGREAFKEDWDDSLSTLGAAGVMHRTMVEAALATGDAPAVLHHLGGDLEEAARISALPPARMGAELAKLAAKLSAPAPKPTSAAPPPIRPVGGTAAPEIDVYDPKLHAGDQVSPDYIARRAKQGAPWAQAALNRQ